MPLPKLPQELQAQFTADDLPGQYLLSRDRDLLPDNWLIFEQDGWLLACHPSLPCLPLRRVSGQQVGFLLGFPITEEGELLEDRQQGFTLAAEVPLESSLYTLSGRWLAIVLTEEEQCIYLDPAGSLPAVYSPSLALVAASSILIPYTESTYDRHDFIAAMPEVDQLGMYPVGMTPRHSIHRLLPNHRLDLLTWQAQRHWPLSESMNWVETAPASQEVAQILKRNIAAVATKYPLQLALTAGRDSRMILACARQFVSGSSIFTTESAGISALTDISTAQRIAKRLELPLKVLPHIKPAPGDLDLVLFRSSCAASGELVYQMRTARQLDEKRAYLSSYISEVGRVYYHKEMALRDPAWREHPPSAETLLALTKAPQTEESLYHVQSWLRGQPFSEPLHIAGLFYIEQRLGAWISVVNLPFADCYALQVWPLNNRRIIELMLSLPEAYALSAGLNSDIIAQEWPELLEFPFNEPSRKNRWQIKYRRWRRRQRRS